jgi:uncharacterized protein (DUF3084 family)
VKPIELWGQQATHWTRASMRWLDRWRDHADLRIDAGAGVSLRRWLAHIAMAAAGVCVAAGVLHLILLAALRSGPGLSWFAVAVVAAIAVVLLVIVVRDTVVSFVAPQRRRVHLVALLVSGAALLASVQACAAATVAIAGRAVSLWQAEQLYAWHLLDSVPLLAIPRRLEWAQPIVAAGAGDRAMLVAFTVALIVPLVRMVVAIYHLTGGHAERRSGGEVRAAWGRWWRLPRSGIAVPLVAAGGFIWGGLGLGTQLGGRIAATSGFAFVGAVAAATLGVILVAVLLSIVISALKAVWEPISDGPWLQLVLAVGLVWIDTPVRQVLLPGVQDFGPPWKVVVTLGLWAVLTVLLLPVWVDPQLPESLLALGLLLGFAGAGAPGSERIRAAFGWTPGGFAVGPAFATAFACLTGAYLVYLLSRAPARAANAGRLTTAGSTDVRRELGGYAYIGLQVIAASAGALMLLYGLRVIGATSASSAIDAPRSLLAVAWHVTDSLPGPDIPAVAGWRLATDFTGPWAGAVVVVTVATLIVVVAFPMIRATLRWAKLKAGPPAQDRPLAEVPAALLVDLEIVRAFLIDSSRTEDLAAIRDIDSPDELSDEQQELLTKMHEAEERLAAAELDRGKLRELLGEESPVYWAGEQAVSEAVDAYRTVVKAQLRRQTLRWSPWPTREASAAEAIAAIEVYAATVERWQMGADVVAEIESRVHDLEVREGGVQLREREAETREQGVQARERGVDAREQVLELREGATRTREQNVEAREQNAEARDREVDAREQSAEVRERDVESREQSMVTREQSVEVREQRVDAREQGIEAREQSVETREQSADVRERAIDTREQNAEAREQSIEAREQSVETREQDAEVRQGGVEVRERVVDLREQNIEARERGTDLREQNADVREREVEAREQGIEAREQNAEAREQNLVSRERNADVRDRETDVREHWVEAREQNAEVREQSIVSRERNAAVREREADAREGRVEVRERAIEASEPASVASEGEPLETADQP